MTTPRDTLIEIMARAICLADAQKFGQGRPEVVEREWNDWKPEAVSAISALISAGWLPVPMEATEEMEEAYWEAEGGLPTEAYDAFLQASPLHQNHEEKGE